MAKWFERLLGEGETSSEKTLREDKERMEASKDTLEEIEEEIEEESKLEMIDVSVTGSYNFKVIEREECYTNIQYPHFVRFHYDVVVNLLGEEIEIKSRIILSPNYAEGRFRGLNLYGEEVVYEWLSEILGSDYLVKELQESIKSEIQYYVKKKNIAKLKETIEKNNNFDINMTFQVEKSPVYEIK
jgi:hypothetical protein